MAPTARFATLRGDSRAASVASRSDVAAVVVAALGCRRARAWHGPGAGRSVRYTPTRRLRHRPKRRRAAADQPRPPHNPVRSRAPAPRSPSTRRRRPRAAAVPSSPPPALAEPPVPAPRACDGRYPRVGLRPRRADDASRRRSCTSERIATRLRVARPDLSALLGARRAATRRRRAVHLTGGLVVAARRAHRQRGAGPYFTSTGGRHRPRVIDLSITPARPTPPIRTAHVMGTVDEVKERLRFGERRSRASADRTRLARISTPRSASPAGLAFVPLTAPPVRRARHASTTRAHRRHLARERRDHLLTRSDAERRWSAYSELRARLPSRAARDAAAKRPPRGGVAPEPAD